MLPNFLIIGAQKAGSTWLKVCLEEHPDVFLYEPKEIRFFNAYFEKGLAWYESHFDGWSGETAVGEKTPGYMPHPEAPARIKATLGEIKLIASIRHPVDRAYSEYWHFLKHGHIPVDTKFSTYYEQQARLRFRSLYFDQLSRYLEYFPRENLLILVFEEMLQHPPKTIADCFNFLEVDAQFVPQALTAKVNKSRAITLFRRQVWGLRSLVKKLPPKWQQPVKIVGWRALKFLPKQRVYEKPSLELRESLLEEFMPDIRRLEELLDRDLSIWYAPPLKTTS